MASTSNSHNEFVVSVEEIPPFLNSHGPRTRTQVVFESASPGPSWPPMSSSMTYPPEKTRYGSPSQAIRSPRRIAVIVEQVPEIHNTQLPPYEPKTIDPPPTYERLNTKPDTVARYLFRYGFVCPLLWIIGASIIWMDLRPVPDLETGLKTPEEREQELHILRNAELIWARRCVTALISLSGLIAVTVIIILFFLWRRSLDGTT